MNLINEPWIQATCGDGSRVRIAPWRMSDPAFVDISAPRPDFRGALFQFLIGLLQTVCPPETSEDWAKWWETPPPPETLKEHFKTVSDAFELDRDGPAFMQDFHLAEGERKPISTLLVEAPGGKTLRENLDHFVKRGQVNGLCKSCAAAALFTLQTNAPSGGVGHRTGLRGGGPLTTLVVPEDADGPSTLWRQVWMNILPTTESDLMETNRNDPADRFPWLGPTRTSETKGGRETLPEDAHPCQMFWGMPRRIRIDWNDTVPGDCDLCGEPSEELTAHYRTKNYGVNYTGAWVHPLSPYQFDPKHEKPPLPVHGQKGGVTYRHWLGLVLADELSGRQPATVVSHYLDEKAVYLLDAPLEARVWAFGYDMDNMKARGWCESVMPVYPLPRRTRDRLQTAVSDYVQVADEIGGNVRTAVKKAWFSRPGDARGDLSFIDTSFWQATEPVFFSVLSRLIVAIQNDEAPADLARHWVSGLRREALDLFDQWALSGPVEDLDMKRLVRARRELQKWMAVSKKVKKLLGDRKPTAA